MIYNLNLGRGMAPQRLSLSILSCLKNIGAVITWRETFCLVTTVLFYFILCFLQIQKM